MQNFFGIFTGPEGITGDYRFSFGPSFLQHKIGIIIGVLWFTGYNRFTRWEPAAQNFLGII
jgi:hypothetical protein